ncbi:MAG: hypothetical protein ACSLFI_02430, partial [Solirubrobacterales bacterium]
VVGGDAGTGRSLIRKYLADGTLDPAFGDDGKVSTSGSGWDSVAERDGKIIVAGSHGNLAEVARFNSDGLVDGSFGTSGSYTFDVEPLKLPYNTDEPTAIDIFALKVLDDGRIRAIGTSYLACQSDCAALMEIGLLADGTPDPDFGDGSGTIGLPQLGKVNWALIEPDGRAHVVTGSPSESTDYRIDLDLTQTSIEPSGQVEPGSESRYSLPGAGYIGRTTSRALTLDDDGQLLIGGANWIYKLDGNGYEQLAPGVQPNNLRWDVTRFLGEHAQIEINDLEFDGDGKLLASGGLNPGCCNGSEKSGFVARFLPNGRPDATFGGDGISYAWLGEPGVGYDRPPNTTTLAQTGDSIVIAGQGRRGELTGFNLARFDAGSAEWPRCDGKLADYVGDGGPDEIYGEYGTFLTFGGNDRIVGGYHSTICAGKGNDRISSLNDDLSIKAIAGPGNDRVAGSKQRDVLRGGPGRDVIQGGAQDDSIFGGSESDRLFGDGWNDRIFGGSGRDLLKGGSARDQLFGGPGRDRLKPGRIGPLISIYRGTTPGITIGFLRIGKRPISIHTVGNLNCSDGKLHRLVSGANGIKVNKRTGHFKRVQPSSDFLSNFKGRFSGRWVTGMFAIVDNFEYSSYTPCWTGRSIENPWVPFRAKLKPRPNQFVKQ